MSAELGSQNSTNSGELVAQTLEAPGRLSRGQFIRGLTAIGVLAATAPLASACRPSENRPVVVTEPVRRLATEIDYHNPERTQFVLLPLIDKFIAPEFVSVDSLQQPKDGPAVIRQWIRNDGKAEGWDIRVSDPLLVPNSNLRVVVNYPGVIANNPDEWIKLGSQVSETMPVSVQFGLSFDLARAQEIFPGPSLDRRSSLDRLVNDTRFFKNSPLGEMSRQQGDLYTVSRQGKFSYLEPVFPDAVAKSAVIGAVGTRVAKSVGPLVAMALGNFMRERKSQAGPRRRTYGSGKQVNPLETPEYRLRRDFPREMKIINDPQAPERFKERARAITSSNVGRFSSAEEKSKAGLERERLHIEYRSYQESQRLKGTVENNVVTPVVGALTGAAIHIGSKMKEGEIRYTVSNIGDITYTALF